MRLNSITTKLLGFFVGAFALTSILVLILADHQLKRILDRGQEVVYTERIEAIIGVLERSNERLLKTSLVEVYRDDFQQSALSSLRKTHYKTSGQIIYPFILAVDGAVIMHPALPFGDRSTIGGPIAQAAQIMTTQPSGSFEGKYLDQEKWYIFKKFEAWDWIVSYAIPLDIKYREARALRDTIALILGGVTLCVLLMLSFLIPRFTRPIIRLTEASRQIAAGRLDQKLDLRGTDEVGILARNFDEMRAAIRKQIKELNNEVRERQRAERAEAETSRMLRLVLDNIPVRVFWKDRQLRYLGCNQPFARDAGVASPEELIGRDDFEFAWSEGDAKAYRQDDRAVMTSGEPRINYEEPQTRADGRFLWLQTSKVPMVDEAGEIVGVLGTYQDITPRKQAEAELSKLRNYLSNIVNSMPSMLVGVDAEGTITQWNLEAQRRTGISSKEAVGRPLGTVVPWLSDEMARVRRAVDTRQELIDPKRSRRDGDHIIYEDVTIYPLVADGVEGAVIRVDDVTEQVRMEEVMIQSEKMLSVGGLAAGMAHEINNPLAGILQTASVIENRLNKSIAIPANHRAAEAAGTSMAAIEAFMAARGIHEMITTIMDSGRRVAGIVANMLSFARKETAQKSGQHLPDLMDKALELAATDYDMKKQYDFKRIEIVKHYEAEMPLVPCEAAKIQQVLLNILRNGAQAMQAAATATPRFVVRAYVDTSRQMVCMEIEDNGPGMREETRKRVFEPFFTTKAVDIGTGLGLSVSYFIITQDHGGEMSVISQPGRGATFIMRLPLEKAG